MDNLIKIDEDTIRSIIADHYNVRKDRVCLCQDYEFVRKGNDKVRKDYIYGIVDHNFTKAEQTDCAWK